MPLKLRVWREIEITSTGVGPVWRWECPACPEAEGQLLFWDNAIRSINNHIRYSHTEVPRA